jgi:hypothetical protein
MKLVKAGFMRVLFKKLVNVEEVVILIFGTFIHCEIPSFALSTSQGFVVRKILTGTESGAFCSYLCILTSSTTPPV